MTYNSPCFWRTERKSKNCIW